jgi:hypothetical protein
MRVVSDQPADGRLLLTIGQLAGYRDLRERAERIRRARQRIAQLHGGDRLFVSPEVAGYLERLREVGVGERTVLLERDRWILLQSVAPEQAAAWIAGKLAAAADDDFRTLYLDCDAAIDWSPDDPRLYGIAERTRQWLTGRHADAGAVPAPDDHPAGHRDGLRVLTRLGADRRTGERTRLEPGVAVDGFGSITRGRRRRCLVSGSRPWMSGSSTSGRPAYGS